LPICRNSYRAGVLKHHQSYSFHVLCIPLNVPYTKYVTAIESLFNNLKNKHAVSSSVQVKWCVILHLKRIISIRHGLYLCSTICLAILSCSPLFSKMVFFWDILSASCFACGSMGNCVANCMISPMCRRSVCKFWAPF
jgi:hypothetical protein